MALLSVQRNEVAEAEKQYHALASNKRVMWHFVHRASDRLLGLLAQTMGRPDGATAHFEDAMAFCRKTGYRPELAWNCCDYPTIRPIGMLCALTVRTGGFRDIEHGWNMR